MDEKNQAHSHELLYNQILRLQREGTAIRDIARLLNVSEVKVRRVLITEGCWSSPTSEEIMALHRQGLTPKEIAAALRKPLKTIQAYMPYTRGEYGDGEPSAAAVQSKAYRKRKHDARERLVGSGTKECKKEENYMDYDKLNEEMAEAVNLDTWRAQTGFIGNGRRVLKLHLELLTDLDDEEEATLRKYGKSEKGISRDILVSEDMPLHNLHYAIQRAFGWQNGHLHNFAYPREIFEAITENRLTTLLDLCGIYFRFPDDENEDLYWDDDYDESVSPRTWLKRKYTAPYAYGGVSEHYMIAQTDARVFRQQNPVLSIVPTFSEYMAGNRESRVKSIDEVKVDEIRSYFETGLDELLERLPIGQVMAQRQVEGWQEQVGKLIALTNGSFDGNYRELERLDRRGLYAEADALLLKADPTVVPLSDTLIYSYDYGDYWQVELSCEESYECFEVGNETVVFDSRGKLVSGKPGEQVTAVLTMGKPVCIRADGLPVLDDVGGVHGFCAFLNGIHGQDCGGFPFEDKEESREWGRAMGWSGRMNKPENIL